MRLGHWSVAIACLAGAVVVTASGAGYAQQATEPLEDARVKAGRAAFREGARLARSARWSQAIESFQRSYEFRPHPVTSYNLGFSERAVGHYARALKFFERALAEHERATLGELPAHLVAAATRYRAEVERQLAVVHVVIDSPRSRISLDGRPLELRAGRDRQLLGGTHAAVGNSKVPAVSFELLVDPGPHVLVFSRSGHKDYVVTRKFDRLSRETLKVRLLPLPKPRSTAPARSASLIAWGVGAAGVLLGSVTGIAAMKRHSALVDVCGPRRDECPAYAAGEIDSMNRYADVSTVAFGVGVLGAAVGTWLWFAPPFGEGSP